MCPCQIVNARVHNLIITETDIKLTIIIEVSLAEHISVFFCQLVRKPTDQTFSIVSPILSVLFFLYDLFPDIIFQYVCTAMLFTAPKAAYLLSSMIRRISFTILFCNSSILLTSRQKCLKLQYLSNSFYLPKIKQLCRLYHIPHCKTRCYYSRVTKPFGMSVLLALILQASLQIQSFVELYRVLRTHIPHVVWLPYTVCM